METFATRLSKAIENHGNTKQSIADLLGVDRTTISHWTSGRNTPNPEQVARLALILNVSCDYLCGLENNKEVFDLPPFLREFIRGESPNPAYLMLAAELKRAGISPKTIKKVINIVLQVKKDK